MGLSYRGHGRGKLLLFGEHAAVKGYPAVGLALDRGISVELEPREARATWYLEDYGEVENAIAREVMKRVDAAVPDLPSGGFIRVASDLPQGRGFGSSAALCTALAEAALAASGAPEALRHRALVWSIAHHAEGYFHGTPSGIDTGLATLGGLLSFRPRPPELPEATRLKPPTLHLIVGSLPRRGDAKALIASVRDAASHPGSPADLALARLGSLAESATLFLSSASFDPRKIGQLADEAETDLDALGIVIPEIATLLEAGRKGGALGGKMSGAGGGGAFYLLYAEQDNALRGLDLLTSEAKRLGMRDELTLEALSLAPRANDRA